MKKITRTEIDQILLSNEARIAFSEFFKALLEAVAERDDKWSVEDMVNHMCAASFMDGIRFEYERRQSNNE